MRRGEGGAVCGEGAQDEEGAGGEKEMKAGLTERRA